MKLSQATALLLTTLLTTTSATAPSITDITNAVHGWRADTATVSRFLNKAESNAYASQKAFHAAATKAYNAELNEGVHKAVLDAELPHTKQLRAANKTLVADGTVQNVVDLLQDLTKLNYVTDRAQVVQDLAGIDYGKNGVEGRCSGVLPAVNVYFAQAAAEVQKLGGGNGLVGVKSVPEKACLGQIGGGL